MAKQYKIKRHRQYSAGSGSYRAKPHPLAVILIVVVVAALVFVGYSVYEPVYHFIMGERSSPQEPSEPKPPAEADPEAGAASTPEPEPEPEPEPVVSDLRAAYLPTATLLDETALSTFLAALEGSEVNAVMVDIKDATGQVLFQTANLQATEWGAVSPTPYSLEDLFAKLAEKNLTPVARMSVFRDPLAASAGRDYAIAYRDSEWLWLDNTAAAGGKPWLNPYSQGARDYNTALALEAAEAGAKLVVLDNVQFPAGSASNASFGPTAAGVSRAQVLDAFVEDITAKLREKGARTAVYLTAISLTQEAENEVRYGGPPLNIAAETVVLGALPYQFGGSYNYGGLAVEVPVQNPGGATAAILDYVALQLSANASPPAIIPLLQGGNEPNVNGAIVYNAAHVDAQISAVTASGLGEYLLYSTTGNYLLQ